MNRLVMRQRIGRELIKLLVRPLLRWKPLEPQEGFSIVLGVPWDLRHLLPVNLRFISRTDLRELRRVHVVFDRSPRPGAEAIIADVQKSFPELPMTFRFHDRLSGGILERVNISTYYNSMNTVLALGECTTRWAVLHDFDLYPLRSDYFTEIVAAMRQRNLRFCGLERTYFDGLSDRDNLLGTWALGIDVQWLRSTWKPIHCFHRVSRVDGRWVNLDPYSYLQTLTPQRGLAETIDRSACCHVQNLCSTYLRFIGGKRPAVAWRLHYLWYLEHLCGLDENFTAALDAMRLATSPLLTVGRCQADFSAVHVTCANVLRDELNQMEQVLFGGCRPEVAAFIESFADFLLRVGDRSALPAVA